MGSKKHFPVSATALFGRRNAENVKSFGQRRRCFVGRQDSLPVGDQTLGNSLRLWLIMRILFAIPLPIDARRHIAVRTRPVVVVRGVIAVISVIVWCIPTTICITYPANI